MKIIVQWAPDAAETALYNLNPDDFIVNIDIYGHFLHEVFWKGAQEYIENKRGVSFLKPEDIDDDWINPYHPKPQVKISRSDSDKKVEAGLYNQRLITKYRSRYNRFRPKFYLYKGDIYSYKFVGFMNVGHVI